MTDVGDHGPRSSQDAIPKDAVWLTEAYEYLPAYMSNNPGLLPGFSPERWAGALSRSNDDDLRANGGAVADGGPISEQELVEWRERRRANLLMRSALASCELIGCVLHPRTGIVLQLHRQGWEAEVEAWADYVPWGIWSDLIEGKYDSPGPSGTLLDGFLCPVFLFRSDFTQWLSLKFGERAKPSDGSLYHAANKNGLRAVDDVNDAITALWGKNSPDTKVLRAKHRNYQINQWLAANDRLDGKETVSVATIKRAIRDRAQVR